MLRKKTFLNNLQRKVTVKVRKYLEPKENRLLKLEG